MFLTNVECDAYQGADQESRILRVAPFLAAALVLHALALIVAVRAYDPYSLSRTGEYLDQSTTEDATQSGLTISSRPSGRG